MTLPMQASNVSQKYVPWLWLLISMFVLRVIAQPSSLLISSRFLPPFESWHGGVLPYPMLLIIQVLILFWLIRTTRQFAKGSIVPNRRLGTTVLILASIYFIAMLARLFLGMTVLSEHRWFASPLPAFFHLVLASFLLLYGHFNFRNG
jgi:hypothetical protein